MVKKREKVTEVDPYSEMESVQDEINDTLKITDRPKIEKQEPVQVQEQPNDYLDEFTPQQNNVQRQHSQPLMFNEEKDENLIKSLLRVDWERIEHIIRGHKPKIDEEGNEYFVKIDNHYLNEYGVNSILHYLSFYLSKDIKLGRYSYDQVQLIMSQFARQFTDWFFDNIEEFGLDTDEKKKMGKMFCFSVIALVDASYSASIEGKTLELILKQFQVLQQEPLTQSPYPSSFNSQNKKASVFQRIFG